MIDAITYTELRARIDAQERHRAGRTCLMPNDLADQPYRNTITNDARSAVEVYELHQTRPAKFTAYTGDADTLTTWTGDHLGRVVEVGGIFRTWSGEVKRYVWVRTNWGELYLGVRNGIGMYINLRRVKG